MGLTALTDVSPLGVQYRANSYSTVLNGLLNFKTQIHTVYHYLDDFIIV